MRTLVLANQKGGVGKSAVATLMSHCFAQHGQRVVAIDFDHQGNFSGSMRRSSRVQDAGITADRLLTESVSVMPSADLVIRHPLTPDRWMVNFGARRLRASRLAGKPTMSCASCTNCIPWPWRNGSMVGRMFPERMCRCSKSGWPPSARYAEGSGSSCAVSAIDAQACKRGWLQGAGYRAQC
jgi:hypothetical protein